MESGVKINKNRLSIRWKIFLFLLLFSIALLLILWLFQVVFLDRFYKSIKIHQVKNSAEMLLNSISKEDLEELAGQLGSAGDLRIEIGNSSGALLYSYDPENRGLFPQLSQWDRRNLLKKAEDRGGEYLEYKTGEAFPIENRHFTEKGIVKGTKNPSSMESLLYVRLFTTEDGKIGSLMIQSVISPVSATIGTLRIQLQYITVFMVLFSIGLAFLLARRISVPLEKLNAGAKQLASGQYETIFEGNGFKEVQELSDTLNQTARELSKVEGLRRELIANVSHDLRTPLTLISGYAEAMQDLPGEMTVENAEIIAMEARRLTLLVNDMLDLSTLQSGAKSLQKKTYDLTTSLKKVVFAMEELAKKEGYHIEFQYDHPVNLYGDESQISRAVYNLLANAVHYTGEDKKVVLRQREVDADFFCREIMDDKEILGPINKRKNLGHGPMDRGKGANIQRAFVVLEVEDTGKGISKEDLPYIWERYYTSKEVHKRSLAGTGLGLSIVRSVAQSHGGTCGVESETGKGSVFWIALPLEDEK